MTHAEAMAWWLGRVDFEKKPAGPGALKLERIRELLHRLGDPHEALRVVHIAGSKGKGSTAAMIEACARAAGQRTGLFTSPHLSDVRERIQVDAAPISSNDLTNVLGQIRPAVDAMTAADRPLTFFEIATALAFLHFAQANVDVAVMEVGLGGRLDSTNVVDRPAMTIITSISYDHVDILGAKLAQIAEEKGGIIKAGVPVVSGVTTSEAAEVIRRIAREKGSPLHELGTDFHFHYQPGRVDAGGRLVRPGQMHYQADGAETTLPLGLLGAHQAANAALAVRALTMLGMGAASDAIRTGLQDVRWPARMEVFPGRPPVVLDCAHNVASAGVLIDTLSESFPPGPRTLVFASSADKDVPGILAALAPAFQRHVMTRFTTNPRATAPERLAGIVRELGYAAEVVDDPVAALQIARHGNGGLVIVTGSVFLAGELRGVLASVAA